MSVEGFEKFRHIPGNLKDWMYKMYAYPKEK